MTFTWEVVCEMIIAMYNSNYYCLPDFLPLYKNYYCFLEITCTL